MDLTAMQRRFADEYILTGNVTESARRAGYKQAHVQGSRTLENVSVQKYIAERTQSVESQKKMDLAEAIELSSSIARGEIQKGYSKQYNRVTGEVTKEMDYEYSPTIEERQKSLEHIIKINGGFIDKKEITQRNIEVNVGEYDDDD